MWNIDSSHCPTASKQAVQLLPALIPQSQSENKADAAAEQVYFSFISQFFQNLASRAVPQAAGPCCSVHARDLLMRGGGSTVQARFEDYSSVCRLSTGGRLEGGQRASLPGAVGAIVGSNSHVAEQLPLCLLTARLCSAH